MCCRCCSVTQQKFWVFGFGTVFLIFGILATIWGPAVMRRIIQSQLPLSPTSKTYPKWEVTPIPVYLHMYLFNWTNAADAWTAGIKPNFEMVGPYVYREERKKEDIIWHANKTVTFKTRRTWFFEPEMSEGRENDNVTAPHLPSIAAAFSMRDSPTFLKIIFNNALNNHGGALYVTHTAVEWLFNGFYDEFLDYAMGLNNPLAPEITSNHFAWFLGRNGSKDFEGDFTVHTGQGDIKQMGEIKFWKGKNHTGWYEGECGRLNGSTTDLFVPDEPLETPVTIFITDTSRIINLEFTGKKVSIEGIEGWKYEATKNTFDNGQLNEAMKCYCPVDRQPDNCPATGATDLTPASGAPMYISAAHFMDADPSYANTITGMAPDYERDNFFIVMERTMGVPLQVNAAVMISLHIQKDRHISILKGITDFYAPIFIPASRAIMNKELAKELKVALDMPDIARYVGIAMICIGSIFIATGTVLTMKRKWYRQTVDNYAPK